MIELEIDKSFLDKNIKNPGIWYVRALASSPLYRIKYSDLPKISSYGFFIRINNKKLLYFSITDRGKRLLKKEKQNLIEKNVNLVLVPQRNGSEIWEREGEKTNIPFLPFPMYPDSNFEFIKNITTATATKYVGFLSGRIKWNRPKWYKVARNISQINCTKLTKKQYEEILFQTTWGIILAGSSDSLTDPKNRREPEFLSVGLPLALNYKPYYLFPFNEGEHYHYLSSPEALYDLIKIPNEKTEYYSQQSRFLWDTYFSPQGVASYFKKIVEEFLL